MTANRKRKQLEIMTTESMMKLALRGTFSTSAAYSAAYAASAASHAAAYAASAASSSAYAYAAYAAYSAASAHRVFTRLSEELFLPDCVKMETIKYTVAKEIRKDSS